MVVSDLACTERLLYLVSKETCSGFFALRYGLALVYSV